MSAPAATLSKQHSHRLKKDYNLSPQQINQFGALLSQFGSKSSLDDLFQLYRNASYDAARVRQHFGARDHNKFLVTYELMPDGTVAGYKETPIE